MTDPATARATVTGCGGELPGIEARVDASPVGHHPRTVPHHAAGGGALGAAGGDRRRPTAAARPMDDQIAELRRLGGAVEELGGARQAPAAGSRDR
ncbi:MAG: hypothetical protein R2695_17490 [Acidimicrobiales bacterium]